MKLTIEKRRRLEGYIFIVPAFTYIVSILGYPLLYNFYLSFHNTNIKTFKKGTSVFVGLANYIDLFHDPTFLLVIKNTFIFTIGCLIFQFTLGFIFALFFSKKFTLAGPLRGLILIGFMMPMAVTAMLGKNVFGVSSGLINDLLLKAGLIYNPIEWLVDTKTAMKAVIAVNCWVGIPFNMLLLTSGLTNISQEVYDSAAVDGAGFLRQFWHITLPLIKPAMQAVLLLGFIYTFKAFDLMFVMTAGGPLNATDVLGTYAYELSFTQYDFSLGATTALVLFFFLFIVGLFYLRMIGKEEKS